MSRRHALFTIIAEALIIAAALYVILTSPAAAADCVIPEGETFARSYVADITNVVDGDSFDFKVNLGFGNTFEDRARLLDADTPEINTSDTQERMLGLAAKAWVETRLLPMPVVLCVVTTSSRNPDFKRGKFGRWLIAITLPDGSDLATSLKEMGLVKAAD